MKNLFTFFTITYLFILIGFKQVFSQVYNFSLKNEPYEELIDPDTISKDFNKISHDVPFSNFTSSSFDLKLYNIDMFDDTITVGSEGYIMVRSNDNTTNMFIDPLFGIDFNAYNNISCITHKIENLNGNNIYKIQWKNVESTDVPGYFINFQLWIQENNQRISFHYGPSDLPTNSIANNGQQIGYFVVDKISNSLLDFLNLLNDPDNPTVSQSSFGYMYKFPKEGTLYEFANPSFPSGISKSSQTDLSKIIIQNPTNGIIDLESFNMSIKSAKIFDVQGKLIIPNSPDGNTVLDFTRSKQGVYFLYIQTQSETHLFKLVKTS